MGTIPHPPNLMEGFRKAIDDSLLSELDLHGGYYTWEKSRGSASWVREKLDRAFATRLWWNKFLLSKISVKYVLTSDHDPLLLDLLNVSFSKKQFHFRFVRSHTL